MEIRVARYAGFCMGVKRALKMAEEAATKPGVWYTMGPLVHNQAVVDHYREKGIAPVESIQEVPAGSGLIIRSHGCSPRILKDAANRGLTIIDATCPLVEKIHHLAAEMCAEGVEIVVFGDIHHPEVEGILGWCDGRAIVVRNVEEAAALPRMEKAGIVSQTTKDNGAYQTAVKMIRTRVGEAIVHDTICPATSQRIQAARELCQDADVMVVIGDPKSSNTATLFKECLDTGVPTYRIHNAAELQRSWFSNVRVVGVTAGASTPDWIIKEVLSRMTEFNDQENQNQSGEKPSHEESFATLEAEMAGIATPSRGEVIKGTVVQVLDDEVMVDVGGKSEGIIPLREMSLKDVGSAKDLVQVGDEIEVLVLKWDDDGTILLSKKKVDFKKTLDELEVAFNEKRSVDGTVVESVKGGLLVDVGVVGFLPASHVDDGYVKNLDDYIGKNMQFNIIEFNRNKRRGSQVVLSRRELVLEEKNRQKQDFWQGIAEGQTRTGVVKRIVDYGAFIDLGGYEGLLHVSELDHRRVEHPADILTEGDQVDVYILGLDRDKERVSLSRKKLLKSPWEIALEKYHQGDIVEGTVVRIAPFGAFVELDPGVDGLVHISQLADYRVEKPEDVVKGGDKVNVKIISIDPAEKRIGLSIKEAKNEIQQQDVQEYLDNQEEE